MNKIIIVAIIFSLFISCSSSNQMSGPKANYIVIADDKEKVLKGYINKSVLDSDPTFKWFRENMKYGIADSLAVDVFRRHANDFKLIVFGGTWCEDTQAMLPLLYRLVEKSGYPESNITLVAVDRTKIGPDDLHKVYNVTNVPTFIVLIKGKEIGRVVEFGKYAQIDKELGEIVNNGFAHH